MQNYEATPAHRGWLKPKEHSSLAVQPLDMEWLSCQPLLPFVVQAMRADVLLMSLKKTDLTEYPEVIEWIRGPQLQKVLDLDLWQSGRDTLDKTETILPERFLDWLQAWQEVEPGFTVERLLELDEELLPPLISSIIEAIPIGIGLDNGQDNDDEYTQTPDKAFWIKPRARAVDDYIVVKNFVDELYMVNPRLAHTLLAQSHMLIQNELIEQSAQWRKGRLADDGFVSFEEAEKITTPKSLIKAIDAIKFCRKDSIVTGSGVYTNDNEIIENIQKTLKSFDAENQAHFLQNILKETDTKQLLSEHGVKSPLEFQEDIATDEQLLDSLAKSLLKKSNFILSNTQKNKITEKFSENTLLIERCLQSISEHSAPQAEMLKSQLTFVANSVMSGLFSEINEEFLTRGMLVTRGAINIGLELCSMDPERFWYNKELAEDNAKDFKNLSEHILLCTPLAFVFQLGWSFIHECIYNLFSNFLDRISSSHNPDIQKISPYYLFTISDGTQVKLSVLKLVEQRRYPEVHAWMSKFSDKLDVSLYEVLNSILNYVPLYTDILNYSTNSASVTELNPQRAPFATIEQLTQVDNFKDQLNILI